jgi:signal transduction histidine kinase
MRRAPSSPVAFPRAVAAALFAAAPVGLSVIDRRLRYRRVNAAAGALCGVPAAHHVGRPLAAVHPELVAGVQPLLRTALVQGEVVTDVPLVIGQRAMRASYLPLRGRGGRVVAVLEVLVDDSAAAEAERRRQELATQQRALLAAMPDMLFRIRRDGTYLDFIAGVGGRPLLPPAQFLGRRMGDVLPADVARRCEAAVDRALASGQTEVVEYRLVVDGAPRDYEARVHALGTDEVLAVVRDVTEERRADEGRAMLLAAEREARRTAEIAVAMRDQFLSAITHDLGQPLTAIRTSAQLGARELSGPSPPNLTRVRELLALIEAGARRMAALASELVDLARLQAGRQIDLIVQIVDLAALVQAEVALQRGIAAGHAFRVELPDGALWCACDQLRIGRVVANLLDNAVKYSPEGGVIAVSLTTEVVAGTAHAVLTVRDQGMGIPAADLARIGEAFYRGGNVVGVVRGSGIGLAGAKQIVAQHGGTLTITSVEGSGTTVTVRLPLP